MTMKISLLDINHLNTMIGENKAENNNVVNEQETIHNHKVCRYRSPTPQKMYLIAYKLSIFYIQTTCVTLH